MAELVFRGSMVAVIDLNVKTAEKMLTLEPKVDKFEEELRFLFSIYLSRLISFSSRSSKNFLTAAGPSNRFGKFPHPPSLSTILFFFKNFSNTA